MAHYDWDLLYFESTPVVEMAVTPHYARYGSTQCEVLAIYREGYESFKSFVELSEEFRLFFNLRQDYKSPVSSLFYVIKEDGTREDVVMIDGMMMLVATSYLK